MVNSMLYKIIFEDDSRKEYNELILENNKEFTEKEFNAMYSEAKNQLESWFEGEEEYDEDNYDLYSMVSEYEDNYPQSIVSYLNKFYGFTYPKIEISIFG